MPTPSMLVKSSIPVRNLHYEPTFKLTLPIQEVEFIACEIAQPLATDSASVWTLDVNGDGHKGPFSTYDTCEDLHHAVMKETLGLARWDAALQSREQLFQYAGGWKQIKNW